jgi:hypothetical protein
MKRRASHLTLLFALVLNTHFVHSQQLTVQTDAGKPVVLSRNDIQALPRVKVTADSSSGPATFEGVTLKSVLERAGAGFGESLRGKRLASCLIVEAGGSRSIQLALKLQF